MIPYAPENNWKMKVRRHLCIANRDTYLCSSLQWEYGNVLSQPCPKFAVLLRHFHASHSWAWNQLQSCWKSFHWKSSLRIWGEGSFCPPHCCQWLAFWTGNRYMGSKKLLGYCLRHLLVLTHRHIFCKSFLLDSAKTGMMSSGSIIRIISWNYNKSSSL